MNERDYLILESMLIASGVIMLLTFHLTYYLIAETYDILLSIMITMTAVFSTFTIGLYIHMKRRLFIYEMTHLEESKSENGQ